MSYPDPSLREQGRQALAQQNLPLALSLLARAVAANPNDAAALALLGMAYGQAGQHAQARQYLGAAVQRLPQNAGFHYQLGLALERAGDTAGAKSAYREALRVNPGFLEAQKRLNAIQAQPSLVQPPAPNSYGPQSAARLPAAPSTPPVQPARGVPAPAQTASIAPMVGYVHQPVPGYTPPQSFGAYPARSDRSIPDMEVTEAFLRRAGARLVDAIVLGAIVTPLAMLLMFALAAAASTNPQAEGTSALTGIGVLLIMYGLPPLAIATYLTLMHATRGQTVGQMVLGLRVITADGSKPTFSQAFLRDTVGFWIAGFFCSLGNFWMLWDPAQQTWADKIGSTYVRRA